MPPKPPVAGASGSQAPGAAPGAATDPPQPTPTPQVRVSSLREGQEVHCFHRYCQDPNGNFFMVDHKSMGSLHPSIGRTDGWTTGVVCQDWDKSGYDNGIQETWPMIRWSHPLWYDRRGRRLDTTQLNHVTQRIPAEQIRTKVTPEEATQRPLLSILSVRWGGSQPVDPVTEGVGGWGQIGSTCSDYYINAFESTLFQTIGPSYEVYSCFIQNSSELKKLQSPLMRHQLRGKHVGAMYYLWPIGWLDGHDYPGYVDRSELFSLMVYFECQGIPTRFPHNSHLYRFFASKDWTASQGMNPCLRTPLTTKVPRSLIAQNPEKASLQAIEALNIMSYARHSKDIFSFGDSVMADKFDIFKEDYSTSKGPKQIQKGVAKLGWSWEALDVRRWSTPKGLQAALVDLSEQTGSLMDYVFVQEWVDFDIEIRNYVVLPDLMNPESCIPKGSVCTMFQEETGNGGFTNFNRFSREECLYRIFQGDKAAFDDCTVQINNLIYNWLIQIRAECSENPVCIRFDMLCKYVSPGRARVTTGELTELGGCFLGWQEGPSVVFGAIIDSYFGRLSSSVMGCQGELAKLKNQSLNQGGANNESLNSNGTNVNYDTDWIKYMNTTLPPPLTGALGPTNGVMAPPKSQRDQQYDQNQNNGQNNNNGNNNNQQQQLPNPGQAPDQQMMNQNQNQNINNNYAPNGDAVMRQ